MTKDIIPLIGMGATVCYITDRYGATVVRVSDSGKTCWVQVDNATPAIEHDYYGVQKWNHTPNADAIIIRFARNAKGCWLEYGDSGRFGKTVLILGQRDSYRDPSF